MSTVFSLASQQLVRTKCVRMHVVHARADVVADKVGIILLLSSFFLLSFFAVEWLVYIKTHLKIILNLITIIQQVSNAHMFPSKSSTYSLPEAYGCEYCLQHGSWFINILFKDNVNVNNGQSGSGS